jgi:hypothetical protein
MAIMRTTVAYFASPSMLACGSMFCFVNTRHAASLSSRPRSSVTGGVSVELPA